MASTHEAFPQTALEFVVAQEEPKPVREDESEAVPLAVFGLLGVLWTVYAISCYRDRKLMRNENKWRAAGGGFKAHLKVLEEVEKPVVRIVSVEDVIEPDLAYSLDDVQQPEPESKIPTTEPDPQILPDNIIYLRGNPDEQW